VSTPVRLQIAAALRKGIQTAHLSGAWPGAYPWHETHPSHNHKGCLAGVIVPASYFDQGLRKAETPDFSGGEAVEGSGGANSKAGTSKAYQKFAAPYGTVDRSKPSNLMHYPLQGKAADVDALVAHHGFKTYYAGGKHGKPDLVNKHFGTGHLMIYAPDAAGTGYGDENHSYTDAWRKTHELAHALTLPALNQKYGEGRRMGVLGKHRTLREAKRAVEWEWLVAHKQRELAKQIGAHISDEDFNRELNTVMHEAVHRAVTGKFVQPQEEGFHAHSHKVPLETALGMVDEAGKQLGLKGEHDLLGR
jgi:hypothetical protein